LLKARRIPTTLWYTHRATSRQLRAAVRVVDTVVTASPESYPLLPPARAIGHGIDTRMFVPSAAHGEGPFRVLTVGRVALVKRLEVVIDAAARLAGGLGPSGLEMRIVGPTDSWHEAYADGLRRQADAAGIGEVVVFAGPRSASEVVAEYQAADAVVSLQSESFDKAPLEAMSCGVPLVTSNPAYAELLRAAGGPPPVPDGDAAAAAETLHRLAVMPMADRSQLGAALRQQIVDHHSLDRLADLLVNDVLPRKPSTSSG